MKITLFTSNNIRHNYLIQLLSSLSEELFVVQECGTIFPGSIKGNYDVSKTIETYFQKVQVAQLSIFGNRYINNSEKNMKILPIVFGDLNQCSLDSLTDFLKSDIYIIFGSSYIKGELLSFLINQKAINIHMGVSPYYRGATIHMLSKGLDSGPILYHEMSEIKSNPFDYTMSTVKAAFHSIFERIKDKSIFNISSEQQNKEKEIRYSKKIEFTEKVVKNYFTKKINLNSKSFNNSLLKDPFYLSSK